MTAAAQKESPLKRGHSHVEKRGITLRPCAYAAPRQACRLRQRSSNPAGRRLHRSRDRCHGGNSPSLASRETPPSGREAAWAGFAELVPDTGPAVEQLPTPKVPSKGWLSALLILRCVILRFGPTPSSLLCRLLLGFHCRKSSAGCSQARGHGCFLSYSLQGRSLRKDRLFRFRRPFGLCRFASLRLGAGTL